MLLLGLGSAHKQKKLPEMQPEFAEIVRKGHWPYCTAFSNWKMLYSTAGGVSKVFCPGFCVP